MPRISVDLTTKKPRGRPARLPGTDDPNHHLMSNRGYWAVCCSINATRATKEKLNRGLKTRDLLTARLRRDVFLHELQALGLEVRMRTFSKVIVAAPGEVPAVVRAQPWEDRVAQAYARALAAKLDPEDRRPGEIVPSIRTRRRGTAAHLFVTRL